MRRSAFSGSAVPDSLRLSVSPFALPLLIRIRRGLNFLAVLFVASVVGYKLLTGKSWLESIYFFVITASTVGYGENSNVEPSVQLLTIGIILTGTLTAGYTIGLIVQSMLEGQINQALGVRRMTREIEQLYGHTIICGFGRIGQTLAEEMEQREKPYVVIDSDPDVVREASAAGVLTVTGDATDEESLLAAGIERAATLVVALHGDADNVFLTLTARNLTPEIKIIARGEQPSTEKKLRQAGADQVVLPAVIGARRMAAMVTRPYAAELLEHFHNQERIDIELEELTLPSGSELVGQTVREAAARQTHQLLIVGVRKSDGLLVFNPEASYLFEQGDTIISMGKREDMLEFQRKYGL